MEDIARLAGVSKSAVSLALGGKPGVSAETRERILRIAKEHGYVPKASGSAETKAGTLTFLVFTNSEIVLEQYYQQPFFRELIYFIEERCRAEGYALIFTAVDLRTMERDIATIVEDNRSEGIVLLGTNLSKEQIEIITERAPNHLVVLDTCFDTLPVHFVEINNRMGGYQAGSHLADIGHTRIGYIASNVRIHNFEERKRGFMDALKERGLIVEEKHEFSVAPTILSSQESLKRQLQAYLASGEPLPSALFCECDYIAISAMKTLAELGYKIPEDVSIVGFDNITESQVVSPELTTVHVAKKQLAYQAVELLIRSIASDDEVKSKLKVDTMFIERASTAPPAGKKRETP